MFRTVYVPENNRINVPIPDKYIGTKLEILVFPINEIITCNTEKKEPDIDISFGGWADMDKTTEEICSEIRVSRTFQNRSLEL